MTAISDFSDKIRTHVRSEHTFVVEGLNNNQWTQDERIAARENCAVCRMIFRPDGEFRAAGTRPEAQEFTTDPRAFNVQDGAGRRITGSPYDGRRGYSASPKLASDAQFKYIKDLIAERELEPHVAGIVETMRELAVKREMTSKQASGLIDVLKAQPVKRQPAPVAPELPVVPNGRYALRNDHDGVDFFVVEQGKGQWEGHMFVSVQASDDLHPLRNRGQKAGILARIAEDPKAASALYGQELGQCGVCGRTLTDDVSRARGIGPVCYDKF